MTEKCCDCLTTKILLVVCGLLAVYFLFFRKVKRGAEIPSVKDGYPFFGQVFHMLAGSPWDVMDEWVQKYGTIFKFHLFGSEAICIADPEILQVILSTKLTKFHKDTAWTYKPFLDILGNGIVTAEGDAHRSQRFLLKGHMTVTILDDVPKMALAAVKRLCVKLDQAKKDGSIIDMAEEFRHLTLQVISETLLSLSAEESDSTFALMYLPIVEEGNARTWHPERVFLPTPAWFKYKRDVIVLNEYVEGLINKRRALRKSEKTSPPSSPRHQDVLDKILEAFERESLWDAASMKEVRDGIKTFVLAGHETTASMLSWALYELTLKSHVEAKNTVIKEAKKVFDSKLFTDKNYDLLSKIPLKSEVQMPFTEACLRESLRKYSVVPTVVRVAVEDIEVEKEGVKYFFQKGATLMIHIQGVHHNPSFWPKPLEYQPERFLRDNGGGCIDPKDTVDLKGTADAKIRPFTFLPFIAGPRDCLGQFLSLLEAKIVLSTLLSKYTFQMEDEVQAGVKHPYMIPIINKFGFKVKIL